VKKAKKVKRAKKAKKAPEEKRVVKRVVREKNPGKHRSRFKNQEKKSEDA